MRLSELVQLLAKRHRRIGRRRAIRMQQRPHNDVTGVKHHHEQARQEPREKDLDDRNIGLHRIDHHGDRRRNQNAERAGTGQRAERHRLVVATLLQFRQRDLGDSGAGRSRRTGDRAEHPAGEHVHMHQPPRQPVQPGREAAKHLFRQLGAEQDLSHPDEQRQCRERPRCARTPDRGREHGARRNRGACELHPGPAGREQRDCNPHAAREQNDQKAEQNCRGGEQLQATPRSGSRARPLLRRSAPSAIRSAADSHATRGSVRRRRR